jgi:hypothetical protein
MITPENAKYYIFTLIILTLWTIPWKAMALWKSARRGQVGWFLFFLLVNTLAIMEIIYLKVLGKKNFSNLLDRSVKMAKSKISNKSQKKSIQNINVEPGISSNINKRTVKGWKKNMIEVTNTYNNSGRGTSRTIVREERIRKL